MKSDNVDWDSEHALMFVVLYYQLIYSCPAEEFYIKSNRIKIQLQLGYE